MNDPNGLTRVKGVYHLFHQEHRESTDWGAPSWAHLVSSDLVEWERLATALTPGESEPDRDGIWSGCVVLDRDIPTAVYTGVIRVGPNEFQQQVCVATSDDDLVSWQRAPRNPVIEAPTRQLVGFRDPWVCWRDGRWLGIVGSGIEGEGGTLFAYVSDDLRSWEFRGEFYRRDASDIHPVWTGRMWECPQLASFGTLDLLVFSVWDDRAVETLNYPVIAVGATIDERFRPALLERFDYGTDCYAPAFLVDEGRVLAWGWSWEALDSTARALQGWAGCLTLPREITVDEECNPRYKPAPELAHMRRDASRLERVELDPGGIRLPGSGTTVEVAARFEFGDMAHVGLDVLVSEDGKEYTRIEYDAATAAFTIGRAESSTRPGAIKTPSVATLAPQLRSLDLRIFVDVSIIEVFVNERVVLTVRAYPDPDSTGIRAWAKGPVTLVEATVWQLAPTRTAQAGAR